MTNHELISFAEISDLPEIDLLFTACRTGQDAYTIDVLDLSLKTIDRWSVPVTRIPRAAELLEKNVPAEKVPFGSSHQSYYDDCMMSSHAAQLSAQGKIFVCMGNFYNGFYAYVIDSESGQAHIFPDTFEEELMLYSSTGAFTPDQDHWLYIRWPFRDSIDIINGKRESSACEIGRARISDLKHEILYRIENVDRIHQIACSSSGRHVVFTPFTWDLKSPYPQATMDEDPEGYRRSHEAGMKMEKLVTVDLELGRHWRTEVPVPVPAHVEFDPIDPSLFYVSSHHFCPTESDLILEGPASLFKMRIGDGETLIEGEYSDDLFFRMTQHVPFLYQGRVLVAVTNFPNKLDLIDAESMSLWRRVELFPAPLLDLSRTGNASCPTYPGICLSVNPSKDGKYIVLQSSEGFPVYSVEEDRLLGATVPQYLPEGMKPVGHTRLAGD